MATIASAIGMKRGNRHGSCRPLVLIVVGSPPLRADTSAPLELLDDADLLIDVDDDLATDQADELDESDLLPG